MRFLKEESDKISIAEFKKSEDIELLSDGVNFIGRYKNQKLREQPLEPKKEHIWTNQIAEKKDSLFILKDQLGFIDQLLFYGWPKAIKYYLVDKSEWKRFKMKYPYKGV